MHSPLCRRSSRYSSWVFWCGQPWRPGDPRKLAARAPALESTPPINLPVRPPLIAGLDTIQGNRPTSSGGRLIFTVHYLDHPQSGETRVLDGWSYFWGAVGGPIYLLVKGFSRAALVMTAVTITIIAGTVGMVALVAVATDSAEIIFVSFFGIVVIAFATQAAAAVELLRRCYLQQGYREGYY
mgnify:FL=1